MTTKQNAYSASIASKKTNYHSGFLSGLEVLLWPYREGIIMEPEKSLSTEGIRMDVLLLKKDPTLEINFKIAKIFREHNIIEYKSCSDTLNIDVFSKVMAYTYLYKSQGVTTDAVHFENISATIYRHSYPRKAFKQLKSHGAAIETIYPGVYYIKELTPFPVQILVGKQLDPDEYSMFRVLLPNAIDDDIRRFRDISTRNPDANYQKSIDNIMQISISANPKTYARLMKEDSDMNMNKAARIVFKEEFEEYDQRILKAEQERDALAKERDELLQKIRELEKQNRKFDSKRNSALT